MKRLVILVGIASLILGGLAEAAVQKGDTEIDLSGMFTKIGGGNNNAGGPNYTLLEFLAGYGYFVTDNVQVKAVLGISEYEEDPVSGSNFNLNYWSLGGRVNYHCCINQPLVPYIGAELVFNHGIDIGTRDSDNFNPSNGRAEGWSWGIAAGGRYEVGDNSDFFLELLYRSLEDDWEKTLNVDEMILFRLGIIHKCK